MHRLVLAVDFDGVIANSNKECFLIGYLAYKKAYPNTKFLGTDKYNLGNFKVSKELISLRPYVKVGEDYLIIFYILDHKIKIKSQRDFDGVRSKLNYKLRMFHNNFYSARKELMKNYASWLRLVEPFRIVIHKIRRLSNHFTIFIVTTRDNKSTSALLKKFRIKCEEVVGNEVSQSKKAQIGYIHRKYNVLLEGICFIDDNVEHLLMAKTLGVKRFLATWGYCNKVQKELAKKDKIVLLTQNNFYKTIRFKYIN